MSGTSRSVFNRLGSGAPSQPRGGKAMSGDRVITINPRATEKTAPKSLSERFRQIEEQRKQSNHVQRAGNRFETIMQKRTGAGGASVQAVRDVTQQKKTSFAQRGGKSGGRGGATVFGGKRGGASAGVSRGGFAGNRGDSGRGGRGRGGKRGGFAGKRTPLDKSKLDKDLDSYMMKDPKTATSRLDEELDSYMNEADDVEMNLD